MTGDSEIQKLLKAARQTVSVILGPLPAAIIVLDTKMRVVLWSGGAKRLFGWKEEEVLGKPNPLIPPDRISEYAAIVNRLLAGEQIQGVETVHKAKDDTLIDVALFTSTIRDEYGTLLGFVASMTDIRGKPRGEKAAASPAALSADKLAVLLDNLPIVPYTCKAEGDFGATYIGKGVEKIAGYTPEQFTSQSSFWADHIHPEDKERVFSELSALFERNRHSHEYRFKSADGSYLWFKDDLNLIRRPDGSPELIVGSWENITPRKTFEMALAESEERFRTLVENSPLCIHEIDMEGKLRSMNPAGLEMMGLGADGFGKIDGLQYLSAVSAADNLRIGELLKKAMEGQAEFFEFTSSGEKPRIFKSCFIPIMSSGGTVKKLMGITEDVTERRRMEDALREEREIAQKYLDEAGVIYVILRADQTVRFISRHGCEMLGVPREEIIGKNWFDHFLPQPEGQEVKKEFEKLMAGGRPPISHFENPIQTHGGERRLIRWSNTLLKGRNGNIEGTLSAGEDVTELREAEKELRAAKEDAERAALLKDKFVSLVAHDLKSPFASMMGLVKLLAAGKSGVDPAKREEIFGNVISSGDRMQRMIDELLDLTRLQTGQLCLKLSFNNLFVLISSAASSLSKVAESKGVIIVNKISQKTRVWVDPALFIQVVYNLISNAIKFTPKGGAITLLSVEENPTVKIAVRDTGVGIPPEVLARLFAKDEKVSTKGTDGETGTGLGLPLAREIMKAHGGDILVESTPGKGSDFVAELPVRRPVTLVVDDMAVERLLVLDRLKGMDLEIIEASNGRAALALLDGRAVDLVISDIKMPEMDGLELLAEIRNSPQYAKLPVILLTSGGKLAYDRAIALGVSDFITKPVNQEELAARVRRFVT